MPYVVTDTCILCGACVSGCEQNAITEGDTQSHIDVTLCIECGTCKLNCPSDAIIYVDEPDARPLNQNPPFRTDSQVAGVGFEPTTSGL